MIKLYLKDETETLRPDKKTIDSILKYSKEYSKKNKKVELVH